MAHSVIGIDVAASGLKMAMLDASIRKLELKRCITHPWAAADMTVADGVVAQSPQRTIALAIDQALITQQIPHSAELFLGFDGTKSTIRVLKFPMGDMKKIEAIMEPELEDLLARPLDEVAYTYTPLTLTKNSGEVLVASAARSEVQELITAVSASGQAPRAFYAEAMALLSLAPPDLTGAVIDMGHSKTHILLVMKGKPLFARTIREGSGRLDRAIMAEFNVDEATATSMKEHAQLLLPHEEGTSPEAKKLSNVIEMALKPLVTALKQTLHLHRSEMGLGKMHLTGGGSLLLGLPRHLKAELGVDAEELVLPPTLAAIPNAHVYSLAFAIGATSIASARHPKLDFRRGEFSFRGDLRQVGRTTGTIGYAFAAVALLALISGVSRWAVLRSDERELDATLRNVTKQMMGREISDFKQALAAIRQSASPEKSALPKYSALEYFGIVSSRIDPTLDVKTTEIDLRQDKINIKGESANYDIIEKMAEGLKGHECFKQVVIGKQRKTSDGAHVEFNVTIDLSCGVAS